MTMATGRHHREKVASAGLLLAACVPIVILAGTVGAIAILSAVAIGALLLSRAGGASTRAVYFADVLSGTSLAAGSIALLALAIQLSCAAARTANVTSCRRICAMAFGARPSSCANVRSGYVDVSELNDAAIGAAYQPERYASLQHPKGLVFLEALTMRNAPALRDTSALLSLLREVEPANARTLVQALQAANARAAPVRQTQRNFAEQVILDSAQAEKFLTARTLAEVPLVVTSTLPLVAPNEPVPGVLALSQPGVDATSSMAIVVAMIRSPQSLANDHVERASLLLLKRNGLAWRVTHEWSLP